MGQGCSTCTSRVDQITDPAVREIVDASFFAIDDLRRRAHRERFGDNCDAVKDSIHGTGTDTDTGTNTDTNTGTNTDTDTDTGTKRTCVVAGQERLLFPNLSLLEKKALASPVPKTSGSGGPSQRPRGRGCSRKIAESFEAERKTKPMTIAVGGTDPSPSSRESGTHSTVDTNDIANGEASEAAVLEDFEVTLSKAIESVCPTRLWIRRRPLPKKRRKLKLTFKTKAKQQKQQKEESLDTGMVLLEQDRCYHRDEDYFGGRGNRDCHLPQAATPEDNENSGFIDGDDASPIIPDPYWSTHIYAIRYSDKCDKDTCSNSSDDERPASSCGSSPLAGDLSPKKRTESPPFPATIAPAPATVAPAIVTLDDASCPVGCQDDEACSSAGGIFGWANMALPPKRDGTFLLFQLRLELE